MTHQRSLRTCVILHDKGVGEIEVRCAPKHACVQLVDPLGDAVDGLG